MLFLRPFILTIAGFFLVTSSYHDYCYDGHINRSGTICLYSRKSILSFIDFSKRPISVLKTIGLTEKNKQILLEEHNKYRQKVAKGEEFGLNGTALPSAKNMTHLKWSPQLEKIAEIIAYDCLDVTYVDKIEYSWPDPTIASINLVREDIIDSKFSLNNYSVLHLFQQWTDHVNLYDPKNFQAGRVDKLKGGVYRWANLIHDQNFKIGCSLASIKIVYNYDDPYKHSQILYCIYRPGAPKHKKPYEPKVNEPSNLNETLLNF